MRWFKKSLLLGCALGFGSDVFPVLAQCAMCRTAIAGSSQLEEIAKVLNAAIVTLLIPPVAIFGLVFWLALTLWNRPKDRSEEMESMSTVSHAPSFTEEMGDRST
ncbi:MAG: hypothetical protein N0A16_11195 [Blastocatellia bacterium]|nr:hypothetical protein [Blastocatellia bacterium]MCS7158281.1 hypothetical protein [Blastocatellia bacterium]MCX7753119.1 hypothetical protein [Blastocatellia bacterium]MDW8169433.1 hypothetical protein [Acidobacteriota bacterium]MDW8255708.1 hypothetical protein [Acidobacteriota bacterium]